MVRRGLPRMGAGFSTHGDWLTVNADSREALLATGLRQAKLPPSGVRTQSAPWFGRFSSIVPRVRVSSANVVPEWSLFVIILTLLRRMAGLVFRLGGRDGGSLKQLKLWVNVRGVCFLGLRGQASQQVYKYSAKSITYIMLILRSIFYLFDLIIFLPILPGGRMGVS